MYSSETLEPEILGTTTSVPDGPGQRAMVKFNRIMDSLIEKTGSEANMLKKTLSELMYCSPLLQFPWRAG